LSRLPYDKCKKCKCVWWNNQKKKIAKFPKIENVIYDFITEKFSKICRLLYKHISREFNGLSILKRGIII
jgi:hypothetical protein